MTAAKPSLDLLLGVPLKNSAAYLPELLAGLLVQTCRPARVLFVDDGSTDNSVEIVRAFADRHPGWPIDIDRNEASVGIAAAYNRIAAASRQTWIQILDADDYLLRGFYRQIAAYLTSDYAGIIGAARSNLWALNLLGAAVAPLVPERLPRRLPVLGSLATRSGVIYRTSDLQRAPFIDPAFDGSDILHLIKLRAAGRFAFVRKARVYYRVHRDAATSRMESDRTYLRELRGHPDAGRLYRLDYLLRKKAFAWLRKAPCSREEPHGGGGRTHRNDADGA